MTTESGQLALVATLKPKAGMEQALLDLVLPTIPWGLAKEGCLDYAIHSDRDQPGDVVYYELWETVAHWDRHREDPDFVKLIDNLLPMLAEPFSVLRLTKLG